MNQRTKEILEQMKKQRALDKLRKQQKQYAVDGKINTAKNVANNLPKAINYGQKAVNTLKTFKAPAASPTALTNSIKAATSANGLSSGLGSASAISDATKAATSVGNTASNLASTGSAISDATKAATTVGNAGSTASSAAGALQGVGKAMPVVGAALGGLSAANNFSKGNHVDGALDLAKTGAMFIPGVGWAVAGAIQVGQMIKNAINKKKQKNIQKNMQRMAENEQRANEKKQDVIDTYGDNSLAINTMPQQNMLGGSTSPANTLNGQILPTEEETSLPEASVSSDALGGFSPKQQEYVEQYGVGYNPNEFNAGDRFKWDMMNNLPGTPTGGAAAVSEDQGYVGTLPELNAPIEEPITGSTEWGQNVLDAMNEAKGLGVDQNVIDAMPQGLNSGNADIAALIDKYTINKPTNAEDVELARQGKFNTPEQPVVTSEGVAIEPSKKDALIAEMMGKFKGGVNNFVQGFNDNANTSFSQGDLAKGLTGAAASVEPKTFLNRLGEVVGTGSRMIANPGLQGLVAGAIKGANTGDWGTGLEYGINWAANKAKSDNYYKRLHPEAKRNPVFSNYDADDFKAYADYEYKTAKTDLQAPTADWYYKQELASKRITPEEYKRIINAPDYDPNARINLKQQQVNSKAENDARKLNLYEENMKDMMVYRNGKLALDKQKVEALKQKYGVDALRSSLLNKLTEAKIGNVQTNTRLINSLLDSDDGLDEETITEISNNDGTGLNLLNLFKVFNGKDKDTTSKYPEGTIAQDKNGKKIIWRNGRWQDM